MALNVYEARGPEVSNGAADSISIEMPYVATFEIEGSAPLLFHRWNNEAIEEKAAAKKGSAQKKSDNVESYVYRNENSELVIPGEYFRMSLIGAAKFRQDPRSPRKSAMDLFKAGVVALEEFCTLGVSNWDYLDRRRVMVQRNGITRERPAMRAGWQVEVVFQVMLPEYINAQLLNEIMQSAGRLIGVGDFRPTYGRFNVTRFRVNAG